MFKKLSLRLRITLLSAVIIIGIAGAMTATSIWGADRIIFSEAVSTASYSILPLETPDGDIMQAGVSVVKNLEAQAGLESPSPPQNADITFTATKRRNFTNLSLILMIVLILVGILLTFIITGRTLKPVKRLSETMRDLDENNLSQRISPNASGAELIQLTASFNKMLDKLERAFETQKAFASAAAHELKTPLACVRANIEVLQLDEHPSEMEYRDTIEVTRRNTDRLIQLVDGLLAMNARQREDNLEPISLHKLTGEITAELSPLILEKELRVSGDCKGTVRGDYALLYRALFNLVENAVKYNRQGGEIQINSSQQEDRLLLTVADTGLGIPEDEADLIFDPFYRVDKSRSRKVGGSGLGLAIVKNIVERYGGSIRFYPNEQMGSVFELAFPSDQPDAKKQYV